MFTRYSKFLSPFIYINDLVLMNVSLLLACYSQGIPLISDRSLEVFFLLTNLSWIAASQLSKSYILHRPLSLRRAMNQLVITLTYQLLLALAAFYFLRLFDLNAYVIGVYAVIFLAVTVIHRSILLFGLDYIRKSGYNIRRIALLGNQEITVRIADSFAYHPEYGYEIVHTISDQQLTTYSTDELVKIFRDKMINEVFICYKELNNEFLKRLIDECDLYHITVKLVSDLLLDKNGAKLINYNGIPVLALSSREESEFYVRTIKRSFDLVFSIAMMIALAPIMIVVAIITRLSSHGPIFYTQQRIGFDEKPFYIYKFRSMYIDAENRGPQLATDNDPRITPWGKFMRKTRLDELPQFWNVFKGDMSVVGPRPERQHFIEQIIKRAPDYRKLLRVKPGITSVGQVRYGYAENVDQMCDRMVHDLEYVNKLSVNGDLGIILRTVSVMLQAKGK